MRSKDARKTSSFPPRRQVHADWARAGLGWGRWEPILLYSLASVDPVLLRALELKPGQRVLDVGCGLGEPALTIARWIAPRGTVVGLDVSAPMLTVARRRARSLGVTNVRFVRGDIERLSVTGPRFHRVVSRFGTMFVEDVAAAFTALHRALVPGGRIALAVWGPMEKNAFFQLVTGVVAPFLPEPLPDPATSPHPMRFSKRGTLERALRSAGFTRIRTQAVDAPEVWPSAEDLSRAVPEISSALRRVYPTLTARERRRLHASIERGAARFHDGAVIRLPGVAWVVSGEKPR